MDKYVGKRLDGRYEIREIIGVGGMAYVYKAYDTIDDRIVAVKILKDEYLNNEEFSRRFKNESKAIAILSHRNIVRVNDVSFGVSLQYIVMEYIDGITLKEYIEQQKVLQWKEVVHFIVQILQALQHAHDKGIVHQDVKPQNIMLLSDGTIKVTDFGIARFSRAVGQQSEQGDKAIGSVHYISPEQARAEITDEKSDIYSVGVMMYEMLTGRLPFESDNAVSVAIMQMQSVAERPTAINPEIPEGLEEITLKAMQKDPLKRYQSAAEMLYDIDEFKNNPSIRFEYQYFSGADDPSHYEEAFSRIRRTDHKTAAVKTRDAKNKEDDEKEEESQKSFPLVPILAGVAGAFLLAFVCVVLFSLGGSIMPSSNSSVKNVEVPDLIGKDYATEIVNNEYLQTNFEIKINEKYSEEYSANTVIEQHPLGGREVKQGTELVLTISIGEQLVRVPTINPGESKETATSKLTAAGFTVKEVLANSDTVDIGCVIRTDPEAGEMKAKGSLVMLYISSGEEPVGSVVVPPVVGIAQADAEKQLTEKGLKVSVKTANHPGNFSAGVVVAQTPAQGSEVAPNSEVVLTVCSGYKDAEITVNMPNVPTDVDLRVEIDNVLWYSESGVQLPPTMNFKLEEQKAKYTVVVRLSEAGANRFQTYAIFTIDGKEGKATQTEYFGFTVETTAAPTTTTTITEQTTTTTAENTQG